MYITTVNAVYGIYSMTMFNVSGSVKDGIFSVVKNAQCFQ